MAFSTIPSNATLKPTPFKAEVSDQDLQDFKQLLKLSKLGPKTYENQIADPKDITSYGIKRDWLANAKQHWETKYDWRKTEARINSYPNYKVQVESDGFEYDVQFLALFSKKRDAVPLTFLHGWPGSILEFLGVLDVLRKKYDENSLPYHVIVPSLPGYGYSSGPPLDKNCDTAGMARVIDKLMIGLGFGNGYVTQGGDIGSFVSRVLGGTSDACKAVHFNFAPIVPPSDGPEASSLSVEEQQGLERGKNFGSVGNAYAREHGTRPATIGLVLSSSPLALLGWIGEKFLQWTDTDPSLDEILDSVSLYWFTDSFPRAIFPYREYFGMKPSMIHGDPQYYIKKPMGYSWFPKEIAPMPKEWVAKTGNLIWHKTHTEGGHFAAMEKPEIFLNDVEDFIAQAWSGAKSQL